jgi:hypothetical protein
VLAREKEALSTKATEMEAEVGKLKSPDKSSVTKTIATELGMEYDVAIRRKDQIIEKLNEQIQSERVDHELAVAKVKDELDVAQENILTLQKAAETLELYKKRITDGQDMKKKIKSL